MHGRYLTWDGCFNARDLGGLPTTDGGTTRWSAVVRSDHLDHLTAAGWAALEAHGIRTIIDLRNDEERPADSAPRAAGITTVHGPRGEGTWTPVLPNQLMDRMMRIGGFAD